LTPGEITADEHRGWFARKLSDLNTQIFIVEELSQPIGQVRLERSGEEAEIHIALASDARGRGLGTQALRLAMARAEELAGVERFRARVKRSNQASLRLFGALGFVHALQEDDDVLELELELGRGD
jgi:RimJ/RimL family protein N-acetyltransferase